MSRLCYLDKMKEYAIRREREQRQTLDFLPGFSLWLKRACSLVSSQVCVCCETPFRNSPQNGNRNFRLSSHCPGKCSLASLLRHVFGPSNFRTWVIPLLPPGVRGRTYPLPLVPHPHRYVTSSFFQVIFDD